MIPRRIPWHPTIHEKFCEEHKLEQDLKQRNVTVCSAKCRRDVINLTVMHLAKLTYHITI